MAALLALSCFWGSQGTAYGEGMVGPQNMEEPMATIILYKELDTDGEEFLPNNWDASQIERNDGLGQRHVH